MSQNKRTRALFYYRDSGGHHEMAPPRYLEWARGRAATLGLQFSGTPEQMEAMIRDEINQQGDIYYDFRTSGGKLSRRGLDALHKVAAMDPTIACIFIPRRDRLARPNNPAEGIQLENRFRELGISLEFMDKKLDPLKKGRRQEIGELITAAIDYHGAGNARRELAEKMIHSQIHLASLGYSTGGRPPYAFRRALVTRDGNVVRLLMDGERVRMAGHHVVWVPGPEEELEIVRRICEMLMRMPASRVAAILTAEGVPTPDHGRERTDGNVRHRTSGVWHPFTINGIARNPLLHCMMAYGRRSMGDQARFTPQGPRDLEDSDFRSDQQPKTVRNPERLVIQRKSAAGFEPIIPPTEQLALIAELDRRGGTQRGKPRSRDPERNPLGSRIVDINCTWPMYRTAYSDSFRYKCGLYQQSHGASCSHNHVDGPTAVRFVLHCVLQRALSPDLERKIRERIMKLALADAESQCQGDELRAKERALAKCQQSLALTEKNMALAEHQEDFEAIQRVRGALRSEQSELEAAIANFKASEAQARDVKHEVEAAMRCLVDLANQKIRQDDYAAITELFRRLNVMVYLRFHATRKKIRTVNRIVGGIITFGTVRPPIEIYQGPTGRKESSALPSLVDGRASSTGTPLPPAPLATDEEGDSLGNVSRGDPRRLPRLRFLAGIFVCKDGGNHPLAKQRPRRQQ